MKLISCYIEHFGGLSGYSLEFSDGLTVIQEANGFGKTTLAEFLRAMFYGFPRKAKTLDKSRRQKYAPWGGGKCGGNLVFEHEGIRYRLERTFGATPRSDSFSLIDLETGRKSDRFSEEIGLELFQLDADSFERSTYMPQLGINTALTTTGIQAKLGDLVEDTSDLGNFDKAMAALKNKRSTFVPYRGSGGSVAAAGAQITRVQQELDRARMQKLELERCIDRIGELEVQTSEQKAAIDRTREQWEQASKAAADRARFDDLTARHRAATETLSALKEKYPMGIPAEAEIDAARSTADEFAALEASQVTTQADLDALRTLEENDARFRDHIPQQAELESARQTCENHAALLAKLRHTGLTEPEQKRYESLRAVFESGGLDEETLDAMAEQSRLLLRQRAALDSLVMSEEDRQRMGALNAAFPEGLPTEDEIQNQRQNLARCEALRRENSDLEARAAAPEKQKLHPLLILGGAAAVLGVVLLIMQHTVPGGVVLAVGVVLAALGAVLADQQKKAKQSRLRTQIAANTEQIADLDALLREFAGGMTPDEVQVCRNEALTLGTRLRALKEKRAALEAAAGETEKQLRQRLGMYFRQLTDFDKAISDLRLALGQYRTLLEKKQAADAEAAALNRERAALEQGLGGFLAPYFPDASPERYSQLLSALGREAVDYTRAREQAAQWKLRKAGHEQQLRKCADELDGFFVRFGQNRNADVRKQLQQMHDDLRLQENSLLQQHQLAAQLAQFPEVPAEAADADALKKKEQLLRLAHSAMTEELLNLRQTRKELQTQADRIPELSDEMERWQEQKNSDYEKSRLLDDTMDFLQRARESLTTSYLGPIRESFAGYLTRLTGDEEQIFMTSDLDVRLERQGQARELGYFSAGQTDTVMLCMRLALVDALFAGAKPFVILDDPFVNLDDNRTAEALKLLQDLSLERQIIYLTCSKSRSI